MNISEIHITGYPKNWDSIYVRDFLVGYGSVLRVRAHQQGYAFVTFDLNHSREGLSKRILSGNSKLSIKAPERLESYKFEEIPPHCTILNMQVGFIRWIENVPCFVELDKYFQPSLMISNQQTLELHFSKAGEKYKLCSNFKYVASIACIEKTEVFEVFLQLNQPPQIYKNDTNRKFFPIWTVGHDEPGWRRTSSMFEGFNEFLSFEIKKLSLIFEVPKSCNSGMLDCLSAIQNFSGFPDRNEPPIPLTFSDIDGSNLKFQVKFLLYSLISLTMISIYDITKEFLLELEGLDPVKSVNAMQQIITSHKSLALRTVPDFTELFYDYYKDDSIFIPELSHEYETINRVLITPSTCYFRTGEPELSNRVTRRYKAYQEDFLRITFVDENLNKILPYPEDLLNKVEENLKHFSVAGKTFKLLAFSASQLKQHSVWMLANESPITHESIINWLGDFSAIRVPGKYVARIGLSFSSSRHIFELKDEEIEYLDDIMSNGYNFSDGAGTISPELTAEINAVAQVQACAFQFRMAGAKGVVCVDDRLTGRKLCLRDSMVKYHSDLKGFELLNPAEFRFGFLNRQIIMLLNTLGTPDDVFITLLNEMLQSINEDCKTFFMCMRAMNSTNLAMQCLDKLMSKPKEPLAQEMKSLLIKRTLNQLRKKQKIFLKNSACIIGVIDEKCVLNYGECFIQVPEGVIESMVIVAKNPCLHPGDVRVLKAVKHDELLYLKNVIVFPSRGPRPHTNECSGSDLDGDLYFVSWETRLIPPRIEEPMIYDATPPMEKAGPFGFETFIEFFRLFVTHDRLGQIDNCHMAIADASEKYASDERCIRLSELHAISVDFAKTGNIVHVPREYTNIPYPDFMEHSAQQSYISQKVLGKLYREVRDLPDLEIPDIDVKNLVEGYEGELERAKGLVAEYKKDLEMLMKRFGVGCEVELVVAQPLELTNYFQKKKREDEVRELLNYMSNKLVEKHRKLFEKNASKRLASACYWVSHKELGVRAYPWIIAYEYLDN